MGRAVGARAFGVPVSWGVAPGWYRKGLWPEKNPPPNGRLGLNTYAYSKNQVACYHCGIGAGRYVSLERIIEENEERWYEVLERSSQRWHEGQHDPWPALNFLLFILTQACKEFEQRVGQLKSPRGEKTEAVLAAVERQISTFRVADLQAGCPGVGLDLIRQILARLQREKKIKSLGTGRGAKWEKTTN